MCAVPLPSGVGRRERSDGGGSLYDVLFSDQFLSPVVCAPTSCSLWLNTGEILRAPRSGGDFLIPL